MIITHSNQLTFAYDTIREVYGTATAKRSGLPLMKHIDDGLRILDHLHATEPTKVAYILHPLFQSDDAISSINTTTASGQRTIINQFDPWTIALVFEYRHIANAYLSRRVITHIDEIALSPLSEVNHMLIADKVQNYHDFMQFHYQHHERSDALYQYFHNWFARLQVTPGTFEHLFR